MTSSVWSFHEVDVAKCFDPDNFNPPIDASSNGHLVLATTWSICSEMERIDVDTIGVFATIGGRGFLP